VLAHFPVFSVKVSEPPTIPQLENPDRYGTPVQTAMIGVLVVGEVVGVLATLAVLLQRIYHLTRDSSAAFYDYLPVDIVSEKPADKIAVSQLTFSIGHLRFLSCVRLDERVCSRYYREFDNKQIEQFSI